MNPHRRSLRGQCSKKVPRYADEEKATVLQTNHDTLLASHPGVDKMLEKVKCAGHSWKGMGGYIKDYVKGYKACQQVKPWKGPPPGKMVPLPVPAHPWKEMMWDLIRALPESSVYNVIAVCIDPYSKEGKFQPTTTSISGLGITQIMRDRVVWD
jgi:hypothetical protein